MCALRLPAQAARIAGAVLPVASSDIGMVAERDPRRWADGPDAKRLGVDALALRWRSPSGEAHDARRHPEGWSTEGFDAADMMDARALLQELQHGSV